MSALMARVARLDADGIYWGLSAPVPLDAVKSGDAVFGDPALATALPAGVRYIERDCDLPAGRYRLAAPEAAGDCWHFVPLAPSQLKPVPGGVSFEQAFYDFLANGPEGRDVGAWRSQYERSLDHVFKGGGA